MTQPSQVDVAIIFALEEEFRAFMEHVRPTTRPDRDLTSGRAFVLFDHVVADQRPYRCVSSFIGAMGAQDAALFTTLILGRYRPANVVVVGLAGSLSDDILVGDVVVADQVVDYLQDGKVNPTTYAPSDRTYRPHVRLKHVVQYLAYTHPGLTEEMSRVSRADLEQTIGADVRERLKAVVRTDAARVHIGHLASGPVVGASPEFARWLRQRDRKYVALEMETAGVMNAVYQNAGDERVLAIRAISDLSDDRKAMLDGVGGGALRALSMRNATRLLLALMNAGELDRNPDTAAPPEPPPPAPPAPPLAPPPVPAVARDIESSLVDLSSRDPMICLEAAAYLAASDVAIERVLAAASLEAVPALAARRVIAAHATRAWPVLLAEIESDNWNRAHRAAELCGPAVCKPLERPLAEKVTRTSGSIDGVRMRILALGRMVAVERAYLLGDLSEALERDPYGFEKFQPYLVTALVRIFARCVNGPDDRPDPALVARNAAFQYERAIGMSIKVGKDHEPHYHDRLRSLSACNAVHAALALDRWVDDENPALRADAGRVLGYTRLSRAVGRLIDAVQRRDESEASWALAMIGGDRALSFLLRHGTLSARNALALRAEEAPEDWVRAELNDKPAKLWALVRAAGLRRWTSCRDAIEAAFEDWAPASRGSAALALARLEGAPALGRLERLYSESAEQLDRLLYSLAVLQVAPHRFESLEASVRGDLANNSFLFESPIHDDVLAVLGQIPAAAPLAATWSRLYREDAIRWHA